MDWITGIQRAIDYVEEHITDDVVDFEEAAKRACASSFNFQRVFSILCGYTLGDYIRMRRLSLAACELQSSGSKVIDVAFKYGYDTPESFSRAFTKFQGVAPSVVKNGGNLRVFSRISVKLLLCGGNLMDYRIENKEAFDLICKTKKVSCNQELTSSDISVFWRECGQNGTIAALCKYIPADNVFGKCIVGACFGKNAVDAATGKDLDLSTFPYGIGAMYNGKKITDEGLSVITIPARTYVIFKCVGRMPDAFKRLYNQIYTEFFPTSEYEPCGGPDFEAYPSADVSAEDYTCEVWVAVQKKKN